MNLEHKKRIIAALIGVLFLFGTYYALGHIGVILLTALIAAFSFWEFLRFSEIPKQHTWLPLIGCVGISLWIGLGLPGHFLAFYLGLLLILLQGLWIAHHSEKEQLSNLKQTQIQIFGFAYIVGFLSFVPQIHALPHGALWLLFLLGIIWIGDTGAYYAGKWKGKHKLSPHVSPGKTWEGSIGAAIAVALFAIVFRNFVLSYLPTWKFIFIALLTSVVAQLGDLWESLMKRAHSVKDSGSVLPGHGGVFDRFDSLILAAPFYYFLLQLLS